MKNKPYKSAIKNIFSNIMLTLVCLGPFGNLVFSIATHEFENILYYAIATFPTLIVLGAYWCWYIMIAHDTNSQVKNCFEKGDLK